MHRRCRRRDDAWRRRFRSMTQHSMRSAFRRLSGVVALLGAFAGATSAHEIDDKKVVDLTYAFGPETIYWPTAKRLRARDRRARADASRVLLRREQHLHGRARRHAHGRADPLRRGQARPPTRCRVARWHRAGGGDRRQRAPAAADADYRLTVDDLRRWERRTAASRDGAIVLMYSGWGERWPDRKRYLGNGRRRRRRRTCTSPASRRRRRGCSSSERGDRRASASTPPSIDHGPSKDFIVHQIINGADKPAFENLANLDGLPPNGRDSRSPCR